MEETKNEPITRLLRLYPVKLLKNEFRTEETIPYRKKELTTYISESYSEDELYEFAVKNFNLTKQNVYLFSHHLSATNLNQIPQNIIDNKNPYALTAQKKSRIYFYFADLKYRIILLDPLREKKLLFKWPIKITVDDKIIIIQFVIVEKNIRFLFPKEERVIIGGRNIDENKILGYLHQSLLPYGKIDPLDINRGIKNIWEKNLIDVQFIRWKKSKSTSTEIMDEDYTLKKEYHDIYEDIILSPLFKTTFKILSEKDKFGEYFVVEPTFGKIIFPFFSDRRDNIDNVIKEILENN